MAIRSFQDENAEAFFKNGKASMKKGWAVVQAVVRRKLDMLDYASELKDLRSPPGNRLEELRGSLQGWYSVRINDQWRIVFRWDGQPYDVRIIDYH
jgi:toxin HigB-1